MMPYPGPWNEEAVQNRNRIARSTVRTAHALADPQHTGWFNPLAGHLTAAVRWDRATDQFEVRQSARGSGDVYAVPDADGAADQLAAFWDQEIASLSDSDCQALVTTLNR
jgi:hypothetical protein